MIAAAQSAVMRSARAERPRLRVGLMGTIVQFGGIERVLLTLLEHMQPDIELVPLLYTRTDTTERSFFERLGALGIPHDTMYVNVSRPKYLNPVKNVGETIAILRKHRVDLIHSHGYRADMIAFPVSKYLRLPVVSTCHGFISTDRTLDLYNRLDVLLLRHFHRVLAVSTQMKQQLVSSGVRAARIEVIANAVADSLDSARRERARHDTRLRLGVSDAAFVFGYVGRLSAEKGVRHLLEAASGLPAAAEWRVMLVGDGPERRALEQATRELGLEGRVLFAGFQRDTAAWYSAMDSFVLPSLTEGTPMALLEAMAHALPVIATSVGGVPAVVTDRRDGILVPPANPRELSEAMRTVASNRAMRAALGASALASVRQTYGVDTWIDKMCDVYTRTAHTYRRSS